MVLKPRMVNIQRLEQSLHHFKEEGHPSYQNTKINEAYDPEFVFEELRQNEMVFMFSIKRVVLRKTW